MDGVTHTVIIDGIDCCPYAPSSSSQIPLLTFRFIAKMSVFTVDLRARLRARCTRFPGSLRAVVHACKPELGERSVELVRHGLHRRGRTGLMESILYRRIRRTPHPSCDTPAPTPTPTIHYIHPFIVMHTESFARSLLLLHGPAAAAPLATMHAPCASHGNAQLRATAAFVSVWQIVGSSNIPNWEGWPAAAPKAEERAIGPILGRGRRRELIPAPDDLGCPQRAAAHSGSSDRGARCSHYSAFIHKGLLDSYMSMPASGDKSISLFMRESSEGLPRGAWGPGGEGGGGLVCSQGRRMPLVQSGGRCGCPNRGHRRGQDEVAAVESSTRSAHRRRGLVTHNAHNASSVALSVSRENNILL
ncbi:uncharacterized protein B0H18DRAFT_959874 [Fomitopsis serialis]|uniref:uncharacterized protein n=1 Tax=Fomitopsis serialis TaxID=139415 RepID=UPI002007A297|nr:uncharacterized protein B0H18DRAFT_959874 [Neoantrodia serialis]KAH9914414.1 hypothetical protein B0H18DRAFT_959874 [Neoantrodia serialis]